MKNSGLFVMILSVICVVSVGCSKKDSSSPSSPSTQTSERHETAKSIPVEKSITPPAVAEGTRLIPIAPKSSEDFTNDNFIKLIFGDNPSVSLKRNELETIAGSPITTAQKDGILALGYKVSDGICMIMITDSSQDHWIDGLGTITLRKSNVVCKKEPVKSKIDSKDLTYDKFLNNLGPDNIVHLTQNELNSLVGNPLDEVKTFGEPQPKEVNGELVFDPQDPANFVGFVYQLKDGKCTVMIPKNEWGPNMKMTIDKSKIKCEK